VPFETEKLSESVSERSEAPKRTGPPEALTVMVPQLIAAAPKVIEPHASAVWFNETAP
jgi:hypothetical protein